MSDVTPSRFEREKLELAAVLASAGFQRAPVQAQLLAYICSRYFDGAAEELNEYAIAFEALGRPARFDNKRDSIVRVEMFALRKRLREYYATEGASHSVQIRIPLGRYAPTFLSAEEAPQQPEETLEAAAPPAPAPDAFPPPPPSVQPPLTKRIMWIAAAATALVAAVVTILLARDGGQARPSAAPTVGASPIPVSADADDIRIMAGSDHASYIDSAGHTWQGDRFFNGGTTARSPIRSIAYTRDPELYQSRREGSFSYEIPLKNGPHELRLYFAETIWGEDNIAGGGEASRLFHIFINEKEVAHNFDVIGNAGTGSASTLAFKDIYPMADGKLRIRLAPMADLPFLNGIEVTFGIPGQMRPIRLIALDRPYTDREGRYWLPDRCSKGGQLTLRATPVSNTSVSELYQGERYGNFSYRIAAPPGRYRLTLYFAEQWFGPGKPAGGGAGSRIFNVYCNGIALLRNFDIFDRAGGADRALALRFRNLEPNGQGRLDLSFAPVHNYACVNAIEIEDEADRQVR